VYILSHILHKNMHGLEYGSGASTLWLSMFVKDLVTMEHNRDWYDIMVNLTNITGVTNVHLMASLQDYVEIPLSEDRSHNIDIVSVDGIKRTECMHYTIEKLIKSHGGIVLLDNSDREGTDNASEIVPKHWLRYDLYNLQKHLEGLETKRWLLNSRTTVWITRDKRCLGSF